MRKVKSTTARALTAHTGSHCSLWMGARDSRPEMKQKDILYKIHSFRDTEMSRTIKCNGK